MKKTVYLIILLLTMCRKENCFAQTSFEVMLGDYIIKGYWQNARTGVWEWKEVGQNKPFYTVSYDDNGKINYYDTKSFDLIFSCYGHRIDCLKSKKDESLFDVIGTLEKVFTDRYYDNGQSKQGFDKNTNTLMRFDFEGNIQYKKNNTTGEEFYFYPNGATRSATKMIKDSLIRIEYYQNGKIQAQSTKCIQSNTKCGVEISYYENGKVEHKTKYVDGKENGESLIFFDNGKLKKKVKYNMGVKDGIEIKFNDDNISNGDTTYIKKIYKNGEIIGKPLRCNEKGLELK